MADITTEKEITVADGLGNAKPEHVLAGVTYSSEEGFNQKGTLSLENLVLQEHITNMNNPHGTTKSHVGLSNVDNTADKDKPVSTKQQAAFDALQDEIEATQADLDELENEVIITDIATGEHITIENSADAGVREFAIDGKTEQATTKGYQLFDASRLPSKTENNATVVNNGDGSFSISGTTTDKNFYLAYIMSHEETVKILKVGTLFAKIEYVTEPHFEVAILDNNNNILTEMSLWKKTQTSMEITENILSNENCVLRFVLYCSANSTIIPATIKPMLYQDGDGTWEPFTGGKATPNPEYPQDIKGVGDSGEVEVTVTGKNIFDISKALVGSFNTDGDYVFNNSTLKFYDYDFKENTPYTFSAYVKNSNNTCNVRLKLFYTDGTSDSMCFFTTSTEYVYMTYTSNSLKTLSYIGVYFGGSGSMYIKGGELQIEEGTVATEYEPYKAQIVKIPSYSMLSEFPLYEGDYLRLKNGKLETVRNNAVVVFDGSDDEGWEVADNVFRVLNFVNGEDVKQTVRTNSFQSYKVNSWANMPDKYCMNYNNAVGFKYSACKSLAEWKTWLSQNPITVVYKLVEPTTETIDTDIDLSTYNHVTNFTNSDNANMEVEYFVNNRHADMVTEMMEEIDRLDDEKADKTEVERLENDSILAVKNHITVKHFGRSDITILGGGGGSVDIDLNYDNYYPVLATITRIDNATVAINICEIVSDGYNNYSLHIEMTNLIEIETKARIELSVLYVRKT